MIAELVQVGPSPADILLRQPRNWPLAATALFLAVGFFTVGALQPGGDELPGLIAHLMGLGLLVAAFWAWSARREVEISVTRQCVTIRRGVGSMRSSRTIAIRRIHAVRLMQIERHGRHRSRIALVADSEDIDCPITRAPRQQALLLAMALDVRLIKIWQSTTPTAPEQRIHQLTGTT